MGLDRKENGNDRKKGKRREGRSTKGEKKGKRGEIGLTE